MTQAVLDALCVNTIRCLAIDMVEKARSGHPGAPLGEAALAFTLWDRFLKHNPRDPAWPDRDRFILSAGHASALLYSLLHLTGYNLSLDDLKAFRQLDSRTPGHPELGMTPGVEATTGPLGQGLSMAVGLALAERLQAGRYNRPDMNIVDHYTWALVSDGDLQEGVASEAASLAGNLQLGKLICLYDANEVQLDGPTVSFTENVRQRFRAYGWNVLGPLDGMDVETVATAIANARQQSRAPNLIICKTVIGFGSPHKAGTSAAHGEPLGPEEARLTKQNLGWLYPEPFHVPIEVREHMGQAAARGEILQQEWTGRLALYSQAYPEEAQRLIDEINGESGPDWRSGLEELVRGIKQPSATRDTAGQILNRLAVNLPNLTGGAADLASSTRAIIKGAADVAAPDYLGRNIRFGVREHAMGAILNGLALHGGIIPFGSTFLVFADYLRPAIRLAALMKLRVIYLFSHDSIGVGEDGPTHQPVEQVMSLRLIPNLAVFRPADAWETLAAWEAALKRKDGPSVLVLSRQALPQIERNPAQEAGPARGGYTLWQSSVQPRVILLSSGSEVSLALNAGEKLAQKGYPVRVVSMPAWSLFEAQPAAYRNEVLPPGIKIRVAVEAGVSLGWERYTGPGGAVIGVDRFGISAPGSEVYRRLGLTVEAIMEKVIDLVGGAT